MNGTAFFTSVKPIQHVTDFTRGKLLSSLPPLSLSLALSLSLSGSGELVQSCLSSTREMNEQKVSVSAEQGIIIKLPGSSNMNGTAFLRA